MSRERWRRVRKERTVALDLRFLDEATTALLGYLVRTGYRRYLGLIFDSIGRYVDGGLIADLAEPTEAGRYTALFDFNALDLEKLAEINGIYFYILAAHKSANYRLMSRQDRKHVLYLRGFDYEGSVATEDGGAAMGFSSMDTEQFNLRLGELLKPDGGIVRVFKVMSPKDVFWETVDARPYFSGDYAKVIGLARYPICSVYMSAGGWQEDIVQLLDRMDHYVVYVSSITESALWELDQLDRDDRRDRVTVVFDEEAIGNKELQLRLRDSMQEQFGDRLIWAKPGGPPTLTAADLRAQLSARFLVTTPDEFAQEIATHRRRIAESSAQLAPGAREFWLDFHFHPAVDEDKLLVLRDFLSEIETYIDHWTGDRGVDCLPLFLTLVQLRIFTTLLMGEHHETGRALACYAAVMNSTHEYYSAPGDRPGALSGDGRERHLSMLDDHGQLAEVIGFSMLSFGRSHEFDDFRQVARATFDADFARTKAAVDQFFATATALNAG